MARTLQEIQETGLDALAGALGPVDMIRFLQDYSGGRGDYSVERHQWLDGLSFEDLRRAIEDRRALRTER